MTDAPKRTKAATSPDDVQFETALKRLEKIVDELEHGSLTLEVSIKRYEEGMALSRQLTRRLEQAQRRVDILMKNAAGELEPQPFDTAAGAGEQA